jgi:hypothetical protein
MKDAFGYIHQELAETGASNHINCLELIINLWKESLGNAWTNASSLDNTVSLKLFMLMI